MKMGYSSWWTQDTVENDAIAVKRVQLCETEIHHRLGAAAVLDMQSLRINEIREDDVVFIYGCIRGIFWPKQISKLQAFRLQAWCVPLKPTRKMGIAQHITFWREIVKALKHWQTPTDLRSPTQQIATKTSRRLNTSAWKATSKHTNKQPVELAPTKPPAPMPPHHLPNRVGLHGPIIGHTLMRSLLRGIKPAGPRRWT